MARCVRCGKMAEKKRQLCPGCYEWVKRRYDYAAKLRKKRKKCIICGGENHTMRYYICDKERCYTWYSAFTKIREALDAARRRKEAINERGRAAMKKLSEARYGEDVEPKKPNKQNKQKKKKEPCRIDEYARKARELGVTYGIYVAYLRGWVYINGKKIQDERRGSANGI